MTYKLLFLILRLVSSIPFRVLYLISDCLYYLIYYVARYRRSVVRRNLTESFPEKTEQEVKRIEKNFYRFFADNLLESSKMTTISKEEISRRMKFTNIEEVNDVLKAGKSVALFMGHTGNWEWCSSMPMYFDKSAVSVQIYHQLRNEAMDKLLLRNRERMGGECVEMRKTARYINEKIKAKRTCVVGFIADQSPRKQDAHYFLDFLNHSVPVLVGTEKIAKHYGFDAWFVRIKRVRRGFYEAEFVRMHDCPESLPDFELTGIYYRMLEENIKAQPELYLWSHNRFKHARKKEN